MACGQLLGVNNVKGNSSGPFGLWFMQLHCSSCTLISYCWLLLAPHPPFLGHCLPDESFPVHCQLHFLVFDKDVQNWWWTQVSCQHMKDFYSSHKRPQLLTTTITPQSFRNPYGSTESLQGRDTYFVSSKGGEILFSGLGWENWRCLKC